MLILKTRIRGMKIQMDKSLPQIAEVIVVEGRDDTAAIKRAVRAVTIETHGFGISKSTWEKIQHAYKDYGIIVFTDPDHAGEEIRRKIFEKFPDAKQAFVSREKATEKTKGSQRDIGIENASPEDIREALEKAKARIVNGGATGIAVASSNGGTARAGAADAFTIKDLDAAGLTGGEGTRQRREKLGDMLGIGYANGKGLLYKLNTLGIDRKTFEEAVKKL